MISPHWSFPGAVSIHLGLLILRGDFIQLGSQLGHFLLVGTSQTSKTAVMVAANLSHLYFVLSSSMFEGFLQAVQTHLHSIAKMCQDLPSVIFTVQYGGPINTGIANTCPIATGIVQASPYGSHG